jgi:AhpD family alkylhydroperoxidase
LPWAVTYGSLLNRCNYCVHHHFAGLKRLLNDQKRADLLWEAIQSKKFEGVLSPKFQAGLTYA